MHLHDEFLIFQHTYTTYLYTIFLFKTEDDDDDDLANISVL